MPFNLCRKHPQGIPFTRIILVICSECGEHEMDMIQSPSRAHNDPNNEMSIEPVGDLCWECFFNP